MDDLVDTFAVMGYTLCGRKTISKKYN